MEEVKKTHIGKVAHYYPKLGVGIIDLTDELIVGDKISIEGATTNVQQNVDSMEIEHTKLQSAKAERAIGLKVASKIREGDLVYKLG